MRAPPLILPAAGFLVWSLAFVLLYSGLSVGCARGWHEVRLVGDLTLQRLQLVLLFAAAVAACASTAWTLRPAGPRPLGPRRFLGDLGYRAALAALGATILNFAAVLVLSTC